MNKTQKEIENCLVCNLSNMIEEFKNDDLLEKDIYNYFRLFMCDSEVDSQITVNVLENERFNISAREEARSIKIYEGW